MLKALDSAECFLTRITDRPEVAAANSAKTVPIMAFFEGCGYIKTKRACIGKFLFKRWIAYWLYDKG
jgi:hypothetical protein